MGSVLLRRAVSFHLAPAALMSVWPDKPSSAPESRMGASPPASMPAYCDCSCALFFLLWFRLYWIFACWLCSKAERWSAILLTSLLRRRAWWARGGRRRASAREQEAPPEKAGAHARERKRERAHERERERARERKREHTSAREREHASAGERGGARRRRACICLAHSLEAITRLRAITMGSST
eukprot:2829411-Prymnesium_polylepis.2